MKQKLAQIYRDLSNGRLTKEQALEKIKAVKLLEQGKTGGLILANPVWEPSVISSSPAVSPLAYAQHYIVVCELPDVDVKQIEKKESRSNCLALNTSLQSNIAERYLEISLLCFEQVRNIFNSKPQGKVLVQIALPNNQEGRLYAGLSGLLKSAALENPQFAGQIILTEPQSTVEELREQLLTDQTHPQDTVIKYEQGVRHVLRLKEAAESLGKRRIIFKNNGVYLITGGLGGLGVKFAKEIIEQTPSAHIILAGRSELTSDKHKVLQGLSSGDNHVIYHQVDIADLSQVQRLIGTVKEKYNQLNGIIHCAGIISDNFIIRKTSDEFRNVLLPKVIGTLNLDLASQSIDLDFMVLFSSTASWMGNLGQSDYASANGFLDHFAVYRNQLVSDNKRLGKTVSINWPYWEEGGMSIHEQGREMLRQNLGMQSMETAIGIHAFYRSLELKHDQSLVMHGDLAKVRQVLFAHASAHTEKPIDQPRPVLSAASEIDTKNLLVKTQDYLKKQLSIVLNLPANKIDVHAPLEKYGIDSIMAMNLTNQLEKTFGSLSKTLFFEYQALDELSEYFINNYASKLTSLFSLSQTNTSQVKSKDSALVEIEGEAKSKQTPRTRFARQAQSLPNAQLNSTSSTNADPIAIVGLSGRYPEANDLQEFWRNLSEGKDCITEVPKSRWDWREYYSEDRTKPGHHYSKWGGFISGVDEFDPRFFNISPREAETIDPQERLFLLHSWMAIEDAGYNRAGLQISQAGDLAGQVGVYAGVMYGEYNLSGSLASIANRVSYVLNLHGPSLTVDTMCSSSLSAIHLACQDLKCGRIDLAIAGGVNVSISPNKYSALSEGQFISSDGHCQSFGEGGDGYIPGEGVGVVVLKRLSEAKRDKNHIYGIIRGTALNHGGKTNGYTVPNPQAQASVISRALTESNLSPQHISYIEAHGTGTKLGDPIEIAALSRAFQQHTKDTGFCLIGSAKSNIGHCESAAGMAGLTKVLLQMKYQQIVPSLHSARLNPNIDFEKTPFVVNQKLRAWEQPIIHGNKIPRIAGISSFGAGGSNAHVIVEEYSSSQEENNSSQYISQDTAVIIPLSARTADQLRQKVRDLYEFIRRSRNEEKLTIDLSALAYTLQVGREPMEERVGFVVNSIQQLEEKLRAWIHNEQHMEDYFQGQVKANKDSVSLFNSDPDLNATLDKWISQKNFSRLLEWWAKGLQFNWDKLYEREKPARVSLPTYPFAKERYWLDAAARGQKTTTGKTTSVLHPLLHANTSDLRQQRFSSTFSGEEFFIKDYRVNADGSIGQKVLPIVATLEMIRAAIEKALPATADTTHLQLSNISWAQPIVVNQDKQYTIALLENDHEQVDYEIYSEDKEGETIYCQGAAVPGKKQLSIRRDIEQLKAQLRSGKLDSNSIYNIEFTGMGLYYGSAYHVITELYKGDHQRLAALSIPGTLENSSEDYVLHPSILEGALQASMSLMAALTKHANKIALPYTIESINILSRCSKNMFAWVRRSQVTPADNTIHSFDIDLCDENGNVCIQMLGISYHMDAANVIEQRAGEASVQNTSSTPRKISFAVKSIERIPLSEPPVQDFTKRQFKKPSISLATSDAHQFEKFEHRSLNKSLVTLSDSSLKTASPLIDSEASTAVSLYDNGGGVFEIQISDEGSRNTLSAALISQLTGAIEKVRHDSSTKVLIISGTEQCFLFGGRKHHELAIEHELYKTIASFPYPVIASMQGDAAGAGFLFGTLCDFMVCSLERRYRYTNTAEDLYPTGREEALLGERFGENQSIDFLYQALTFASGYTGEQLKRKGWTCPVLSADQVKGYVADLASNLSKKNQESLRLLKQHLARRVTPFVNGLEVNGTLSFSQPNKITRKKAFASTNLVRVEHPGENILVLRMLRHDEAVGVTSLVADLRDMLDQVRDTHQYKVVVLASEFSDFFPESSSTADVIASGNLMLDCGVPVIAVLGSKAQGKGWFVSHHCDATIYQAEGRYRTADILHSYELAGKATMIFTHRLGNVIGQEILLTGREYTGADLQARLGTLMVGTQDMALKLAESWATLPEDVLIAWKRRRASGIQSKMKNLPPSKASEEITTSERPEVPAQVPLKSKAVIATAHPEGILEVRMEDRAAKNMFSADLINGITEVFAHVQQRATYKVVVLTGYDNYFASGGTKESLLAIHEGKVKFTDNKIYHLAMECNIPVIAAMQGHGIGAGWSMGMFADLVLISEESKYMSPYMNYGFTPGAGATMIFPRTIGYDLARETMLTAQEYSGSELKSRGVQQRVLPRGQVCSAAMNMARDIAMHPVNRLMDLKKLLTQHLPGEVEEAYSLELSMHEKTFVGKADTLNQIERNFNQENNNTREEVTSVEARANNFTTHTSSDTDWHARVNATIKQLLAQELHIHENEIDGDAQFVDLGLDSITGVTWIRKINEKYKTFIEATKVYSYTTLNQMSRYVREEAENAGSLVEKVAVVTSHQGVSTPATFEATGLSDVSVQVKRLLAQELHMQEHEIDEDAQFVDLGLDSITGVTWIRKINDKYKTSIEATKVYSYPTLAQMSRYVEGEARKQSTVKEKSELKKAVVSTPVSAGSPKTTIAQLPFQKFVSLRNKALSRTKPKTSSSYQPQPIAVIGMAGQFAQANNIETFWQNIAGGKNCISEVPGKRWDINAFYQDGNPVAGKTNCKFQGSLEGYDLFDPLFFSISPVEAESMDPQQRLFLQACWHSIEDAGYNPKALSGSKCGVFVGAGTNDYQLLSRELQISAQGFTGVSPSILAARISYFLNLQGPCLSIETACSSSLVAIASACDSLVTGASDVALAGGVNVIAGPDMFIKCAQSGMLSQDGKCYTFDQRANGFVPGEGVGVVMLKRLADAERDQDTIYGVIQGWGVNQDGKTNGITAPNSESQTRLEQEVYDKFGIDPNQIQLIEAHGTGTKLGDPIEVDALKQSFKKYTEKKEYCAIGSVKSNIGHCLTAAGVASFIKVLKSLEYKKLPPTINYDNLNEHIKLKDSPFYVNTQLKDWTISRTEKRQAAISAFGFSGTNAHIVVSEYNKPANISTPVTAKNQPGKVIIPLSARTTEQLKQQAIDLLDYIQRSGQSVDLMDMAYTLQVGREAMEVRLGLSVHSVQDLEEKLRNFIEGKEHAGIHLAQVKRNNEASSIFTNDDDLQNAVETWINRGKFDKFLDLWVKGLPFDWQNLYPEKNLKRLRLPVYPFAKEHYWISARDSEQSMSGSAASAMLHPLLHTNTSDLSCQKYSSTFNGEEFFFKDHQVNGQRILPGVGYLEMARVAIALSAPGQSSNILELYNTTWFKPFAIASHKQVSIALYESGKGQIDYEIYSLDKDATDASQEILYCQGQAEFRPKITPKVKLVQLTSQMRNGRLDASKVYSMLAKMGFNYGPAHQGITSILLGENQVLAHLRLPSVIDSSSGGTGEYFLHPSLMDSALQATVGLITDLNHLPTKPSVPFLLETLRIISPCTREMLAWIRHSNHKTEGQNISKVDIDVCDMNGNICVQMEGFTSRVMPGETNSVQQALHNFGDHTNNSIEHNSSFDETPYKKLLSDFLNKEVSIDEALDLVERF